MDNFRKCNNILDEAICIKKQKKSIIDQSKKDF